MSADVGSAGYLVRVRYVDAEQELAYIDLVTGAVATAYGDDVADWTPGDVLHVTTDDIGRTRFDPAPPELWPQDAIWVGVVRIRLDDVTVVEVGGGHRRVPTNVVPYEVGHTVEARDTGVLRVLSPDPIRYLDLDRDRVDVTTFVHTATDVPTFDEFGGLADVKARARELVETPLRYRDALDAIGARPVKGVLFTGPPGTGKTMLARIIAGAAGASFYQISGPEIVSKWHGESENVLRSVFRHAEAQDRSIIFFDEIDSIAVARSGDAHEASKRLVAQLLTLMDGFAPKHNVVVIAATNRPQDIDPALLRPGRFDWTIDFPLPDEADRVAILTAQASRLATEGELPHNVVAARTTGWSGADLSAIFSEAALLAVTDARQVLMAEDYLGGLDRVTAHRSRKPAAAAGSAR